MDADRAMAGAGTAGDHGGGGAAGQLAIGFGHVDRPGFKPAGHELQLLALVVHAVERVEEAFARNLEHMVDALGNECVGQDPPAVTCPA